MTHPALSAANPHVITLGYAQGTMDVEGVLGAARSGSLSLKLHVFGYWSEVATLYVRRETIWSTTHSHEARPHSWVFELSHSSGGRDRNVVAQDLEAEELFADGLRALIAQGRALRLLTDRMEAAFQEQCAVDEAAEAAESAAKAARLAADPEYGPAAATTAVREATRDVKSSGRDVRFEIKPRGGETPTFFTITLTRTGTVVFRDHYDRALTRAAAVALLAESSATSARV